MKQCHKREEKVVTSITVGKNGAYRIKVKKKLSISDLLPLKMLFLVRVWVTNLDTAIYVYWNQTIQQLGGGCSEPSLFLG